MYTEEIGIDNNETIILVSGMFFGNTYRHVAPLALKYRLVTVTLPGYGEDADRNFEVETAFSELLELCESYGQYTPVHIVGFCTGADLVYKLICERPELFRSAVLISPVLYRKEQYIAEVLPAYIQDLKKMKASFFAKFIAKYNALSKEDIRSFVRQIKKVTEETVRNSVDNGISFETVKGFENFSGPLLVMAGKKERPEIVESVKRLTYINDHCECEILKDATHNIPTVFGTGLLNRLENFYMEERDPGIRRMKAEDKWEDND